MDEAWIGHDIVQMEYTKAEGELPPGKYWVDIQEYTPKVRYHIRAVVLGQGDEPPEKGHACEAVLTYLSKQELERSWRKADIP